MFEDREEAGRLLARRLAEYRSKDAVVYALPRGGVVLGFEVARFINAPLDLIIVRKVGHPSNPEYAICAVTEKGKPIYNEKEREALNPAWLDKEIIKEREEAKRRREKYLKNRKHYPARGKIAIVVDDGVATGLTLMVALRSIREEAPRELIVAVPVIPRDMADTFRALADKTVFLKEEEYYLGAVGAYYQNFPQVTDEEVIELLEQNVLN
ncbi:phosphoribosyl transferase [Candidatus Nomurabacteria bacterium]|nr:phosphoribosyl transferase [Candidatus Nomurabacteria bacterium]